MPLSRFEECWPLPTESPPLKPQHRNTNPNPLAYQLCSIDFLTPPTPLIIHHRLPAFLESLMPLKKLMLDSCKIVEKQSEDPYVSVAFFSSLKLNFIAYRSSKVSDCIFEIDQL